MQGDQTPLFVRLSAEPTRQLERAVAASGKSKRQLVEDAVREHLKDERLVVGHIALPDEVPEILTLDEAAALLRLEPSALEQAARDGQVPGRQIAGSWRFSKAAIVASLDHVEEAQKRAS